MTKFLQTTAVAALLLGATACGNAKTDADNQLNTAAENAQENITSTADNAEAELNEAAEDFDNALDDAKSDASEYGDANLPPMTYLAATEYSAENVLGAPIFGSNGEEIAWVDDLVVGDNGDIELVVFKSGDVLGLGGKRGALDYDKIDLTMNMDNEARVDLAMSEEAIQSVAEYKTEEMNDYSLVSELIGTTADLMTDGESARINDLVITNDGDVKFAIVSEGIGDALSGDYHAIDFAKVSEPLTSDGNVVINMTLDQVKIADRFSHDRETELQ